MLQTSISITGFSSISALGITATEVWTNYQNDKTLLSHIQLEKEEVPVAALFEKENALLRTLQQEQAMYENLDRSVILGILAARRCVQDANWCSPFNFGINIGSSRGATQLFERYHREFLEKQVSSTLSSPTTTLGNISSWIAQDLQTSGPEISHSITCSTALHAVLNGVAWLQSGLADKFMVGGSEAPLTPFTIAQMKALKIYTSNSSSTYPCRALDLDKNRNGMLLGEGAAMACLEKGKVSNAKALITGIGYATEKLKHAISISAEANCFQKSMKMALGNTPYESVDVIVMHSPGTVKGDLSEYKAIQKIFGAALPALTTNKWKIGHTFGASGMLSLELAMLMLQHQQFILVPYLKDQKTPDKLKKIMVNAVGFGGNAVSVLIEKPY